MKNKKLLRKVAGGFPSGFEYKVSDLSADLSYKEQMTCNGVCGESLIFGEKQKIRILI
jgi:hypothetical protein